MLVKWLGLFPVLVAFAYFFTYLGLKPLWLMLFVETLFLIPLLNYAITPFMDSLFAKWLYEGIDEEQQNKPLQFGPQST